MRSIIFYVSFSTEKIWTVRNIKRTTAQCKLSNGSSYLKK